MFILPSYDLQLYGIIIINFTTHTSMFTKDAFMAALLNSKAHTDNTINTSGYNRQRKQ